VANRKKVFRIVLNNGKLWPSTINCGSVTVQFQTGKHGRRVTFTSKRHKPRHKRLAKG